MLCNSIQHHECCYPFASWAPLWDLGNAQQQLCFTAGLQESWEMSTKLHRHVHPCKEAQVQAPRTSAAWNSYHSNETFSTFCRCTGFPDPSLKRSTQTPPKSHYRHLEMCSEPFFKQIPQGHIIMQPRNQARKAGALMAILILQLHSSSYVIFSDPCLSIIKTNIIIGRLKTSSTQFWINTLCLATIL